MRVLVATTAGDGHFGPLVPFASACVAAGHDVRVASPEGLAGTVTAAGFTHAVLGAPPQEQLEEIFAELPTLSLEDANVRVVRDIFGRLDARAALPALEELVESWQPDVILRETTELASYVVSQRHGVPAVQVAVALASLDDFVLDTVDEPLREQGVPDGSAGLRAATTFTIAPARMEPDASRPTYRFAAPRDDTSPQPLPQWWDDTDAPLVYMSFGTVAANVGLFPSLYDAAIAAVAELDVRLLVTTGSAADLAALAPTPPSVHVESFWPQRDVMPHVSAAVGHGGYGTTMATLSAGVPTVAMPLFAIDQHYNAKAVADVGAGLALEGGVEATASLAEALRRVLADEDFASAAARIAQEMEQLPPVSTAPGLLERLVQ